MVRSGSLPSNTDSDTSSEDSEETCDVDRETEGSPTPPPQGIGVEEAVRSAPNEILVKLVLQIWHEQQQSQSLIDDTLRCPIAGSKGLKRKVFETCRNCHEVYDARKNYVGLCEYHDGGQEVDSDSETWGAHDILCHGDPLDPQLMQDPIYEDGYVMECCSKRPYEAGCVISRHKPVIASSP